MKKMTALLIGLGQIGCGYDADLPYKADQPRSSSRTLSHARALACHPGFTLLGGVDPNPDARKRFSRIYGLKAHVDLNSWYEEAKISSLDLVVIAVPPELQTSLVGNLLEFIEPRLLLLEKPVAISTEQAHSLLASCAKLPEMGVAVNYIRRWLPPVLAWQQRLQASELGSFLHGQIVYGKGLLSNGSHFVNLAEAWLGSLRAGRLLQAGPGCFGFDREVSLELMASCHDDAPLLLRSVGAAGLRAGELDLWFQGGRLCWCNDGHSIAFWPRGDPSSGDTYAPLVGQPEIFPTGMEHYQLVVLDALYRYCLDPGESPLECDLSDGIRTLETIAHVCADAF